MLRTATTLLLLLQLRPLAGAAICLEQSLATSQTCEMATVPHSSSTAPAPHSASDCPLAELCAIPAGAVLAIQPYSVIGTLEASTPLPSYLNTLFTTDPAAPLVPPPNA